MPRLYNWIKGEGTVKNQRWGLGDINANDPNFGVLSSPDSTTLNYPYDASSLATYVPNVTNSMQSYAAAIGDFFMAKQTANGQGVPTIGVNWPAVIGVGLVAYLLIRR